jgi:hypothetical protein
MSIDLAAAEEFVEANARVLDRHRLAVLLHGASAAPVLDALRPYRNADGGFGHALEPDIRDPNSQPVPVYAALEIMGAVGALDDPMVAGAGAWIASIAEEDGGVPFVLPTAAEYPRAPWMEPSPGGSMITFAIAANLLRAGSGEPWLERASEWCWNRLSQPEDLSAHAVRFGLQFLDNVPDEARALETIETLSGKVRDDGSIPVTGGAEDEQLTPLALSERPGLRSRAMFTDEQIEADLDRVEGEQQDDGGWVVDFPAWSPGQGIEWRGAISVWALERLGDHGRLPYS